MKICILDEKNICKNNHPGMEHPGHYAKYAVSEGEKFDRFRELWTQQISEAKRYEYRENCKYLGKQLTKDEASTHRQKLIDLKLYCKPCEKAFPFHCSHPESGPFTEKRKCLTCNNYKIPPFQPIKTRHLIYHIYPVSNGAWRWNVEQLCGRLKCFNGRRLVAIAVDPPTGRKPDPTGPWSPDRGRYIPGCDSVQEVKDEFSRRCDIASIEFLEFENDPSLREVKTIIHMLNELRITTEDDPTSATLYGQAKGVTRHNGHIARTRWSEAIYELYLDYFPLAMEQLLEYPVTGCFKKLGAGWSPDQSKSDWHYSGSWFWFRNAELFKRNWKKIDQFWSGIEPYPSQQFFAQESGCMFHEAQVPTMNLYSAAYWRNVVLNNLGDFRNQKSSYRTNEWPR